MSDLFIPVADSASQILSSFVVNGHLSIATDTKELFLDNGGSHLKISDVVFGTYSDITNTTIHPTPLTNKVYFATDTHQLLQAYYENNTLVWRVLNAGEETQVVTNSNAAVTAELDNNTIYNFTNNAISSITLTAANTLDYCTICFTAGSSTTFSPPSGARCIGYDCTGGILTLASGKEYQIAVDKLGNQLTFYVLRVDLNAAS